ncbi:MAG TPA: endonuclease/exonuclease/phosphatase family protein [Gaiellaceae bacterium]|nr:endonuclease/exonuclease/phosphatase family protein [Gaiellaceae bacterium]
MVVRTWNLFHGNSFPSSRKGYLREMVELITADRPDVVCLQEIPAWALPRVGEWGQMQSVWARARRSKLGPFPIPAVLGRALTAPHHGLARSGFAGQGNAILFPNEAKVREDKSITLNTNPFCEERGSLFGLSAGEMVAWEKERRVLHLVKYELPNRLRFLVGNLHATSRPGDLRLPDAELRRGMNFVIRSSELEETLIVAGDFNITRDASTTVQELVNAPIESRWTSYGEQIDQVLLRRAVATSVRVWPDEERVYNGKLLSDHAPVEVQVELRPKG